MALESSEIASEHGPDRVGAFTPKRKVAWRQYAAESPLTKLTEGTRSGESESFTCSVIEMLTVTGYRQHGSGPWKAPPFPGTKLGPTSNVRDGEPPHASSTKQNNRRSNVSIPYTRRVGQTDDTLRGLQHGELVFTHRYHQCTPGIKGGIATNSMVDVFSMEQVNKLIRGPFDIKDMELGTDLQKWLPADVRHWQPDGVVNVTDDGLEGDVANVTVQGPASMVNGDYKGQLRQVCCSRGELPLSRLYVGLRAIKKLDKYKFELHLFSSMQVRLWANDLHNQDVHNTELLKVWQYGRILDSRDVQSTDEHRIKASIFVQPPMILPPTPDATAPTKHKPARYVVDERLKTKQTDGLSVYDQLKRREVPKKDFAQSS